MASNGDNGRHSHPLCFDEGGNPWIALINNAMRLERLSFNMADSEVLVLHLNHSQPRAHARNLCKLILSHLSYPHSWRRWWGIRVLRSRLRSGPGSWCQRQCCLRDGAAHCILLRWLNYGTSLLNWRPSYTPIWAYHLGSFVLVVHRISLFTNKKLIHIFFIELSLYGVSHLFYFFILPSSQTFFGQKICQHL